VTARLGLGAWTPALAVNPTHEIGAGLSGGFAAGPQARPVEIVSPHAMDLTIEPLLRTAPTAEVRPGPGLEGPPLQPAGPQTAGIVASWELPVGEVWRAQGDSAGLPPVAPTARLLVFGDASIVMNRYLGLGANRPLALGAVHWLTWQERFLGITRELRGTGGLRLTPGGLHALLYGVQFGLPLCFMALGLAVWARRRARA
jgi:hypothetical protein